MKKAAVLFSAVLALTVASFAQNAPSHSKPANDSAKLTNSDPALPQPASQMPLFGILAVGFLCAGYMTLRTD